MSIKEIYKEANTHAVIKKSDKPVITSDVRPSMYDLLKLPIAVNPDCANYIDNDLKALVEFIAGKENE